MLELEVRVIIKQEITNYDHGENDYNINALLNANFNKVKIKSKIYFIIINNLLIISNT